MSNESVYKNELAMFFGDTPDKDDTRQNDSGDEKDNGDPEEDTSDCEDCVPPSAAAGGDMSMMPQPQSFKRAGGGNTGVKGVLADYAEFKENQRQEYLAKQEMNRQMLEKMCVTIKDKPQKPKDEEEEEDEDLKRLREKRLAQLKSNSKTSSLPKLKTFGYLKQISQREYVEEIDNEPPNVFVIIHLYQNYIPECILLNQQLSQMAVKYSHIKFLKILSTDAKADYHDEALPTLLVYIGGKLLVSFIPITMELEKNFVKEDLEMLLASYDIIPSPIKSQQRWEHSLSDKKSTSSSIHKQNKYDDEDEEEEDDDY
ncbi:phosducin-like protein [Heterostelium album PN500]|uniref:Phosducin-like protein n=1 Tax=Heterostelium pallidum (strain ATCC 26659 / Pp 5 / PN500) TaxID=670386 RepID=D3B8S3_HETP5|nr:phosducin-like protein [Heterostelium album PN500]EFA82441.1 phosducin-like protein [Heterostelium album PN500]|eukprot:XP_020434558.1 phosducin-like protein [Heterostelium album PN500]